jgi:hypothetical protein
MKQTVLGIAQQNITSHYGRQIQQKHPETWKSEKNAILTLKSLQEN